jgi:hypothetical protein
MFGSWQADRARGRHRSTSLVEITPAVAADLAALSEALDEPGADLSVLLHQLAADAKFAVSTFVGLTVRLTVDGESSNLSAFEAGSASADVRASLLLPLPAAGDGVGTDLVLYASTPGAFTDLAADLAWLTGRKLTEFALDEHLVVAASDEVDGVFARSLINQAIGMLIARGHTPEQAERELDAGAVRDGVHRHIAARQLLTGTDDAVPDAL